MSMDDRRLTVASLAGSRGGRILFDGLDFELLAGDLLLVRGPNGSGKTSLLRLLSGTSQPGHGTIAWNGIDIRRDLPGYRSALHLVTASDGLKPALTVEENLRFATDLLNGSRHVEAALGLFELMPIRGRPVRFLSSGQRRRSALARLMAVPRPLWLLDEPETGLDRDNRLHLALAVRRHREQGGVVVVASHAELDLQATMTLEFDR